MQFVTFCLPTCQNWLSHWGSVLAISIVWHFGRRQRDSHRLEHSCRWLSSTGSYDWLPSHGLKHNHTHAYTYVHACAHAHTSNVISAEQGAAGTKRGSSRPSMSNRARRTENERERERERDGERKAGRGGARGSAQSRGAVTSNEWWERTRSQIIDKGDMGSHVWQHTSSQRLPQHFTESRTRKLNLMTHTCAHARSPSMYEK